VIKVDLLEAIKTRRSIRKYTDAPVDDAKINTILEAGRWAPSWANTQCSRFIVIRDAKIRAALADTVGKMKTPDGKEVVSGAAVAMTVVPVVIAVCAQIGISGTKPGGGGGGEYITDKGDWFMFDTALAVENMVLAAHALGLGTVIMGAYDPVKAEKVLNIPRGYRLTAIFPVGVPAAEGKAPPRKELSELVIKDKFK
jgi:nitroreductase